MKKSEFNDFAIAQLQKCLDNIPSNLALQETTIRNLIRESFTHDPALVKQLNQVLSVIKYQQEMGA